MRAALALALALAASAALAQQPAVVDAASGLTLTVVKGSHAAQQDADLGRFWRAQVEGVDAAGKVVTRAGVIVAGCTPNRLGVLGQLVVLQDQAKPTPHVWHAGGDRVLDKLAELVCATAPR